MMILLNSLSGQYLNTPIDAVLPVVSQSVPELAGVTIIRLISAFTVAVSFMQLVSNLINVLIKLGLKGFITDALPGLVPII